LITQQTRGRTGWTPWLRSLRSPTMRSTGDETDGRHAVKPTKPTKPGQETQEGGTECTDTMRIGVACERGGCHLTGPVRASHHISVVLSEPGTRSSLEGGSLTCESQPSHQCGVIKSTNQAVSSIPHLSGERVCGMPSCAPCAVHCTVG
jgi:hypothetical protein